MCDKRSYRELRGQVLKLERADAAQTEQIRTLFNATAKLESTMTTVFTRIVWVFAIVLLLAILALVYGAVGGRGFNAVTRAAGLQQQQTTQGD